METTSIRAEEITRDWYLVDAENQTLGRLASRVAQILREKINPILHLIWIWVTLLLSLMLTR